MKKELLPHEWVKLPEGVRYFLRDTFKIGRRGAVEVVNNKLISDGTSVADLQAMSIGHLIEYLGEKNKWYSEELFTDLLNKVIEEYEKERKEAERAEKAANATQAKSARAGEDREGA